MVAMNKYIKNLVFLFSFFTVFTGQAQDNFLKKNITLRAEEKPLELVLMDISNQADFTFSFNASILVSDLPVSITAHKKSVKSTLDQILPENIEYKVSGNHLILLKKKPIEKNSKPEKYTISGIVHNAIDREPLQDIVVYEVSSLISTITDQQGAFSITVPAQFEHLGLSFNNREFADTIVFISPQNQNIEISINPVRDLLITEKLNSLPVDKMNTKVESIPLVQRLVSTKSFARVENMDKVRLRIAQFSLLPVLGTNLKMSGLIENKYSLNLIAGYSHGITVLELGGMVNIVRKDVVGVQVGGVGNFVGRDTKGVQLGGIFNHNRGAIRGVQIAGVNNKLVDTLRGVQISGINNIIKGELRGVQIAGINNLTTDNVYGVQVAGLTNLGAHGGDFVQVAGLLNYAKNASGFQIAGLSNHTSNLNGNQVAGFYNYVTDEVKGVQLSGFLNVGKSVKGAQFSFFLNIATGTLNGVQFSGLVNYASYVKKLQMGIVNVADTASGIPIGIFSYVKKGFHTPELYSTEISMGNVAFKTGVSRFYNIFTVGVGSWTMDKRWMFGYGFGSERTLKNDLNVSIEYTANWVNEEASIQKDLSFLNRLDLSLIKRRAKGVVFSAGPSINLWFSEWRDPESDAFLTQLAPYTIFSGRVGSSLSQMWVGGKIGVQL